MLCKEARYSTNAKSYTTKSAVKVRLDKVATGSKLAVIGLIRFNKGILVHTSNALQKIMIYIRPNKSVMKENAL